MALAALAPCHISSARPHAALKAPPYFTRPVAADKFYRNHVSLARDTQQSSEAGTMNKTSTTGTQPRTVQMSVNSEASILITNGQGKRVGFDTEKNNVVNEIPGAVINNETRFPTYLLPFDKSGKPYTIILSGKPLKSRVETNLTLTGPGFLVGFKGIHLDAGENLTATIGNDGRLLAFTAGQSGETPTLSYAVSAGHGQPSYKFEIGPLKLAAGKTVSATLDTNGEHLFFRDDDEKRNKYSVMMRRTNPDGTQNVYRRHDISFGATDNYLMEYGKWDGQVPVCFKVDDGKGFDQSICVEMPNEAGAQQKNQ
jgi:hypothetical protein